MYVCMYIRFEKYNYDFLIQNQMQSIHDDTSPYVSFKITTTVNISIGVQTVYDFCDCILSNLDIIVNIFQHLINLFMAMKKGWTRTTELELSFTSVNENFYRLSRFSMSSLFALSSVVNKLLLCKWNVHTRVSVGVYLRGMSYIFLVTIINMSLFCLRIFFV